TLDGGVQTLLRNTERERAALANLLAEQAPSAGDASLLDRLTGSRFVRSLRDFQQRDLAKLVGLEHGANFSVPGAGKTAVTYALYELEKRAGRVTRLLVVAPLSAFDAWEGEAERCFQTLPSIWRFNGRIPLGTEVVLVNYQKLKSYYEELNTWLL